MIQACGGKLIYIQVLLMVKDHSLQWIMLVEKGSPLT